MANLTENQTWHEGIYQIERNDPVSGGKDGVSNKPLIQLGDRTAFLKKEIDTAKDTLSRALTYTTDNEHYQAEGKRIENLADPVNENDAVNKIYVDHIDGALQNQINTLNENSSWGWELIGNFTDGCNVTKRSHIVYDEQSKQYYNWVGELPYVVLAQTDPITEIEAGKPWIIVNNTDELASNVEAANRLAQLAMDKVEAAHLPESLSGQARKMLAVNQTEDGYQFIQSLSAFYGFRKNGAKLIIETGEGNYNTTEFNEWFISGTGATFSIDDNGNLLINL